MRAYLFLLLLCPIILVAQEQQPVNGATDCPTFGKKNVKSKAGMFAYMRSPKSHKNDPARTTVYQTSALPDLKKAQEDRDAEVAKRNNQPSVSRKQRPVKERKVKQEPVATPEENIPEEAVASTRHVKKEEIPAAKEKEEEVKEETIDSQKNTAHEEAKEKREKKAKRTALKAKTQRIFKSDKKRTSRKNVQKCPSF
ncbi:MAG TPA: hypothetical protein PLL00_14590 [Bacteroidia bacterium]|jgi:hypothetical protein|nr:hypothetical protein [Bacteroidia bacterium]